MKSKIKFRREPIEELSKAYMKELRAHNRTKRVYEVDPYAEVYQFREDVYGIYTQSADGMGDPWMYLINGPERAMLIDTSFGIGDLKGLVKEIIGEKELLVVNTHSSYDHSYGNCQFDRVYCHKVTEPFLRAEQTPHLWDYLMDEKGEGIWLEFDRNDIIPYKEYEIIPCENNYVFELGENHRIELIWLPGHHAGHTGYLDRKNRILFCGDSFLSMRVGIGGPRPGKPYPEYFTVKAFRDELEKLVLRLDEFDTLFPGHFIVDIDNTVIPNMLEVCRDIVEHPENFDFQELDDRGEKVQMLRFVRGLGTIAYRENSVK